MFDKLLFKRGLRQLRLKIPLNRATLIDKDKIRKKVQSLHDFETEEIEGWGVGSKFHLDAFQLNEPKSIPTVSTSAPCDYNFETILKFINESCVSENLKVYRFENEGESDKVPQIVLSLPSTPARKSLFQSILSNFKPLFPRRSISVDGDSDKNAEWIVIDLKTVLVHIFDPQIRLDIDLDGKLQLEIGMKFIVAMSGGVDSAISAYILKKQGYAVEAVFMNNWDSRAEEGMHCTRNEDLESIEQTCKILSIEKLHHVNYQSSYWQRVFSPVLEGYQNGRITPNPDILCNREIKFGDLFKWVIENRQADFLATGHYARISDNQLMQARDLVKDQTYFLAAINRNCLNKTIFPVGNLFKAFVKSKLVYEANLNHLLDRKESMGVCFIGKRAKFQNFMSNFIPDSQSGPILDLDTGKVLNQEHKGLSRYTLGQNVSISGAKSRLYVAGKDHEKNVLLIVNNLNHHALWKDTIIIKPSVSDLILERFTNIYCSIRSVDKFGVKVKHITNTPDGTELKLEGSVFAPCPGQWAVLYGEDENFKDFGRVCLGGGPIN